MHALTRRGLAILLIGLGSCTPNPGPTPPIEIPIDASKDCSSQPDAIGPEQVEQLTELVSLGRGALYVSGDAVVLSPDRTMLAASTQAGIWLYAAETLEFIKRLPAPGANVTWSPASNYLILRPDDGSELAEVWHIAMGERSFIVDGYNAEWSPDGQHLASIQYTTGRILIWDTTTATRSNEIEGLSWAWSPDGKQIAIQNKQGQILILEVATGAQQHILTGAIERYQNGMVWSPDGTRLIALGAGVAVIDTSSWQVRTGPDSDVYSSAPQLSLHGGIMVAQGSQGRFGEQSIVIWNIATGRPLKQIRMANTLQPVVAWSPIRDQVAIANTLEDDGVYEIDLSNGEIIRRLSLRGSAVSWSPDGGLLAVNDQIWDIERKQTITELRSEVYDAPIPMWLSDNRHIVTVGQYPMDNLVRLWDVTQDEPQITLDPFQAFAAHLVWSPDGTRIVFIDHIGRVAVWQASDGQTLRTLQVAGTRIASVDWSSDGRRLVTGGDDKMVRIWDVESGEQLLTLQGHWTAVREVDWSPDGARIASLGDVGSAVIIVWDAENGQQLEIIGGAAHELTDLAWAPNGIELAASQDGQASIWSANGARMMEASESYDVDRVAWSPDGAFLLGMAFEYPSPAGTLWHAPTGRMVHVERIGAIGSLSCKLVAIADASTRAVHLLDPKAWMVLRSIPISTEQSFWDMQWSPDGTRLALALTDGTIKIWGTPSK